MNNQDIQNQADEPLQLWNNAANDYIQNQMSEYNFHTSVIDQLIGDVKNKEILDAGCGDGQYAKKLAEMGAIVIGIDGSTEMIHRACRNHPHPYITYKVMDLTKPLTLINGSSDIIIAQMVMMDLPEIETCISEFSRILRPDGWLIFSITHPCFFSSDWVMDETGARTYKKVTDYLSVKSESLFFWGKTIHYHRPLSYYFQYLEKNGFSVHSLHEPIPDMKGGEQDPDIMHHFRIPSFMVIKAGMLRG